MVQPCGVDPGRPGGLAATGLETETLPDPAAVKQPALILLGPAQKAPTELANIAIERPPYASPVALRELVRVAMENVALKQQLTHLENYTHPRHPQSRHLNRLGIATSADNAIERLQSFI